MRRHIVLLAPVALAEPKPDDPDPRAQDEMAAFDRLSAEARAAIANSPFGAGIADLRRAIARRGASPVVRERLAGRGVAPCDVGTDGCLLEEIAVLEEAERKRIRDELA